MYPKTGAMGAAKRPQREFWERRLGRGSSWGLGKENNTKPWVPPTRKISPPLRGCDIGSLARGTKNIIPRTCTPRPGRWGPRSGPRESFGRDVLVKKEISKTGVHLLVLLARYHPHYVGAASNTPARGTKNIIPRPCTPRPGRWGPRSGPVISYSNSQLSIALSQKPRFREVGGKVLFHSDYIENYRNEWWYYSIIWYKYHTIINGNSNWVSNWELLNIHINCKNMELNFQICNSNWVSNWRIADCCNSIWFFSNNCE